MDGAGVVFVQELNGLRVSMTRHVGNMRRHGCRPNENVGCGEVVHQIRDVFARRRDDDVEDAASTQEGFFKSEVAHVCFDRFREDFRIEEKAFLDQSLHPPLQGVVPVVKLGLWRGILKQLDMLVCPLPSFARSRRKGTEVHKLA